MSTLVRISSQLSSSWFLIQFTQATAWISQLRDATEHNLGDIGRNSEDVEALQQEHEKLETTARVRGMGWVGLLWIEEMLCVFQYFH